MADHGGTEDDPRWQRIVARDKAAEGSFWFSVITTGIYCRPGCPARTPLPQHVAIHDDLASAQATGARPCLRCKPDDRDSSQAAAAAIDRVIGEMRAAEAPLSLTELAARTGFSLGRFRRLFASRTGLTPGAFAAACRAERVRDALAAGEPVTQALHGAGYGSSTRFYAGAQATLGMAPAVARKGGAGERLRYALRPGPLGLVLVARSEAGVASILLGDVRAALVADLRTRFPRAVLEEADDALGPELDAVLRLIREPAQAFPLPLDARGTAFQKRVWDALQRIPAGSRRTYTQVAAEIGEPGAVRAVAGACAANPLALAIPCHRVVRSDGALSGYRWGVERKRALLDGEAGRGDLFSPNRPGPRRDEGGGQNQ